MHYLSNNRKWYCPCSIRTNSDLCCESTCWLLLHAFTIVGCFLFNQFILHAPVLRPIFDWLAPICWWLLGSAKPLFQRHCLLSLELTPIWFFTCSSSHTFCHLLKTISSRTTIPSTGSLFVVVFSTLTDSAHYIQEFHLLTYLHTYCLTTPCSLASHCT